MIFEAALAPGLAVKQTARGAQNTLPTAGQRPPVLCSAPRRTGAIVRQPSALHRLRAFRSHPPTPSRSAPPPTEEQLDLSTRARGSFLPAALLMAEARPACFPRLIRYIRNANTPDSHGGETDSTL
jgi:hypothetical protein